MQALNISAPSLMESFALAFRSIQFLTFYRHELGVVVASDELRCAPILRGFFQHAYAVLIFEFPLHFCRDDFPAK